MLTESALNAARNAVTTAQRYATDAEMVADKVRRFAGDVTPLPNHDDDPSNWPDRMSTAEALLALQPPHLGAIFVNYRRSDTADVAQTLAARVRARIIARRMKHRTIVQALKGLGSDPDELWAALRKICGDEVSIDVQSIDAGELFEKTIDDALTRTSVFLALIGQSWETSAYEDGRMRLRDANDFVRVEIESALRNRCLVIPVLIGRTAVPDVKTLPGRLALLFKRSAVIITGRDDVEGIDHLLDTIDAELDRRAEDEHSSVSQSSGSAEDIVMFPGRSQYRGEVSRMADGRGHPVKHGRGHYQLADGSRVSGRFDRDMLLSGVMTWPDGDTYEGEFRDVKMDGLGVYTFADQRRYRGQFKADLKHGFGSSLVDDGYQFDGEYRSDQGYIAGKSDRHFSPLLFATFGFLAASGRNTTSYLLLRNAKPDELMRSFTYRLGEAIPEGFRSVVVLAEEFDHKILTVSARSRRPLAF